MLRIEHLTKKYGEKAAVDDLTLHIAPGEIYGFIATPAPARPPRCAACPASCSSTPARSSLTGSI